MGYQNDDHLLLLWTLKQHLLKPSREIFQIQKS